MGKFDLDPCANRLWALATNCWHVKGFYKEWSGRVWLNPPYGEEIVDWMEKMADHGNGIALVFARTETAWFHDSIWNRATAVFFFRRRLKFYNKYGVQSETAAPAPSVLVAYNTVNAEALANSGLNGRLVTL